MVLLYSINFQYLDKDKFISPFLNFDPALLVSDPNDQFIFPEGEKSRGRFERSFSEIGALVMGGAALGGTRGFINGIKDPEVLRLPNPAIRRTQILNHITKSGGSVAQTGGSIGLIYAISDFFIHKIRNGADDSLNTFVASTSTGFLYTLPSIFAQNGWLRIAKGTSIGACVGLCSIAFTNGDKVKKFLGN